MGKFSTGKRWAMAAAATVAVAAAGVSAGMIWDGSVVGTTNETMWDSYAYYYLEGYYNTKPGGEWPNHHKPCFATKTCRTDFPNLEVITSAKDAPDADGEWPYKGGLGGGFTSGGNALYMKFSGLGPVSDDYTINPEAGVGLLLSAGAGGDNPKGLGTAFETATAIKFKIKMSADIKQVRFKIESTKTGGTIAKENAYGIVIENTAANTWLDKTISIGTGASLGCPDNTAYLSSGKFPETCKVGDLTLADWFGAGYMFDKKDALKIAWQISTGGMMDKNSALTAGEVWIDNIEIVGYDYVAPDICTECVGAPTVAAPTGAWLLSDLEAPNLAVNAFGRYWYYYNDAEIKGGSDATGGIKEDEYSATGFSLDIENNEKGYNGSNGAWISYVLGDAIDNNGVSVKPFVGLGTELFTVEDGDTSAFYGVGNVSDPGVYFLYNTNFDATGYLSFEAHDAYAFRNPDGGEVYGVRLPGTGGAWKSATIPFSRLRLPGWAAQGGDRKGSDVDFNKGSIAKFQFKVDGVKSGDFAIDNVYIKGAAKGTGIKYISSGKSVGSVGMRATYSRGVVGVNWSSASSVASGKISLINTKGRVVASAPIATADNKITAKLGAGNIPTGMYFVRVSAKDVNGKKIVQSTPLSIVK